MINLAFYSDQIVPENGAIDDRLLAVIASNGLGPRIGYIPSGPEPDRKFFKERRAYYACHGLDLCIFYDLEEMHTENDKAALFRCDAIHLSGGQTGGFLARLKRSGLISDLRMWAADGGLLIGTSAGAIILTPTIATDALFAGNDPEDFMNETALDLVPFEFFPHLSSSPSFLPKLIGYSQHTARPIFACNDGEGLVVTDEYIECIGHPLRIANGEARPADTVPLSAI
ncbi:Type 1 glutamine amidotransferase-like domain-containing protein [uncultured Hoeflea sp.]|uniref:Type 1 glutamine amidotransferase-like domain-containing protein n=1 Tax=uncultured Hoeflea sp. TaxID=538666 RepID=UPI0030DA20E8